MGRIPLETVLSAALMATVEMVPMEIALTAAAPTAALAASRISSVSGGMRMGPERPQQVYTDSETMRQAVDFINMGKYQFADSVLNGMPGSERNARWYYLSSLANYGLNNQMLAVTQIQKALQLEPNNALYQRTLQSYRYAENVYSQNSRNYQRQAEGVDKLCRSFCLAQLFCMFCRC